MTDTTAYKHYTIQAKTGIRGEAFFESLISEYSIPHQIVGSKDIGLDFICEWVYNDKPSGVLFGVQIKSFTDTPKKKPQPTNSKDPNRLDKFTIKNSNLKIKRKTLIYWKGLSIPIYLFTICLSKTGKTIDCFYKRFTTDLTRDEIDYENINFMTNFYKVNKHNEFLAFHDFKKKKGGFVRDLFIDHMRCNYSQGNIAYFNPRILGLNEFVEENAIFDQLFEEYEKELMKTYSIFKTFVESHFSYEKQKLFEIGRAPAIQATYNEITEITHLYKMTGKIDEEKNE